MLTTFVDTDQMMMVNGKEYMLACEVIVRLYDWTARERASSIKFAGIYQQRCRFFLLYLQKLFNLSN